MFRLDRGPLARVGVDLLRRSLYLLARVLFPFDVQGLAYLPREGPYLLCPNHASRLDGALICMALPGPHLHRMIFLGFEQYFQTPLMRWLARVFRVLPTATSETVLPSLRRAAETLRGGRSACIFPEGMVTRDGNLQRPRPGAGILACELGVPVVPVLVRGTFRTLSFAHRRLRFVPVGLTVGRPISPPAKERFGNPDYEEVMAAWTRTITELRRRDDDSGSRTADGSPRIPPKAE